MFKTPLIMQKLDGIRMRLCAPLVYEGSVSVTVPKEYVTDGATVPRVVWWVVSPYAGNHLKPAVLHDYLCDHGNDQRQADLLFLEAMKANGVGWFKRTIMFNAVRVYQWSKGRY